MMKKLSAVAIAVFMAGQANAAIEVVNNDTTKVELAGRAYAGQFLGTQKSTTEGSEKYGENTYIRMGLKGETAVNDTMKAVGEYEAQFKSVGAENDAASNNNLTTRLAYGGIKAKDFGTVTFGRQKGAVSTIAAWTDVALSDGYGNSGLGIGTDTYGTYRAGDMLKYTGKFNDFQLDVDYKFSSNSSDASVASLASTETKANAAAYGAALSYKLMDKVSFGTGYNVGLRDVAGAEDAKLWVIGAMYDDKAFYAALNFDKGSDYTASGTDMTGTEAALGYNFANGFGLMATYNKQKTETNSVKTTTIDYYTLGTQYKFNKNFRVIAEYRINNKPTTSAGYDYKNDYQLAARYDF